MKLKWSKLSRLLQRVVFLAWFASRSNFWQNCRLFKISQRNTTASTETLTEKWLGCNFALDFTYYLFITLSKILRHSKTMKNAKKLSVFGENDSRCLPNFLQTHTFWIFDHISRIYNRINYRNIWFAKVIIILIMTPQELFFDVFFRKRPAP